jgi:hypothetical protein
MYTSRALYPGLLAATWTIARRNIGRVLEFEALVSALGNCLSPESECNNSSGHPSTVSVAQRQRSKRSEAEPGRRKLMKGRTTEKQ